MANIDRPEITRRGLLAGGALLGVVLVPAAVVAVRESSSAASLVPAIGGAAAAATIPVASAPPASSRVAIGPRVTVPRQRLAMVGKFGAPDHGWAHNGVGSVNLNDTTDYALGSQCVSITTSGGGNVFGQRSEISRTIVAFDLTSKAIKVWFRVASGFENLDQVRVLAGSDAENYYVMTAVFPSTEANNNNVTDGQWGSVVVDLYGESRVGSPDSGAITYLNLRISDNGGGSGSRVSVNLGGVALVEKPVATFPHGVITLGFDDGFIDQYTTARTIMDRFAFPGQAYVIGDLVDATNVGGSYMGLDQLHKLEDLSGWEVSAHSLTIADHNVKGGFASLTDAQLRANLDAHKSWGMAQGFRGFDHFAYPQGLWSPTTVEIMRQYFSTARITGGGVPEMPAPNDPQRMRTYPINAGTPLEKLTAVVDQVKAGRFWAQFYTHRVLSAGAQGTRVETATFTGLVDYIAAVDVPVRTVNEVIRPAVG